MCLERMERRALIKTHLSPKRVSAYSDIHSVQATPAFRCGAFNLFSQQNHAGTGAPDALALSCLGLADKFLQRLIKTAFLDEQTHSRAFTARHHKCCAWLQLLRRPYFDSLEGHFRCRNAVEDVDVFPEIALQSPEHARTEKWKKLDRSAAVPDRRAYELGRPTHKTPMVSVSCGILQKQQREIR